jgi:Fe-S-cluster containining protein
MSFGRKIVRNDRKIVRNDQQTKRVFLPIVQGTLDAPPRRVTREWVGEAIQADRSKNGILKAARLAAASIDDVLDQSHRIFDTEPECSAGCSHCCHLAVDIYGADLVRIVHHVNTMLTPDERAIVRERAAKNTEAIAGKLRSEYPNVPCAMLDDEGMCRAYSARPLACRRWHSLDARKCEDGTPVPLNLSAKVNADFVTIGLEEGLQHHRLDARAVDLQMALHFALEDESLLTRWIAGKRFPDDLITHFDEKMVAMVKRDADRTRGACAAAKAMEVIASYAEPEASPWPQP